MKIKICGITNLEDAVAAVEAGADAVGFVFHPQSPRVVEPDLVRRIVRELPPLVVTVGVFVNEEQRRLREILDWCGLALAQLHGDETAAYCESLGRPAVKAVRVRGREDLLGLAEFRGRAGVRGFVVDSWSAQAYGGTGRAADWDLAAEVARLSPVILAGGLRADNVAQAVAKVRPYGVDVSSGVERAPGRKDPEKIRAFVAAARLASREADVYTP